MVHDILKIKKVEIHEKQVQKFTSEKDFVGLSIDVLIEVGSFVCVAANLYPLDRKQWNRDEAILGGHLVRLYKLISAMLDQTTQFRRETTHIFARLAFECIINLRYLIKHASSELFNSYIDYSLKHEKKLRTKILENIKARGGTKLNIESRMLSSIDKSFKISGVSPDNMTHQEPKNWGNKNIYEKADDLGLTDAYLATFGGGSHSIHGNWQDLLEFHLITNHDDCTFRANIDWHPPRPQILNALSLHATQAIIDYVKWLDPKSSDNIVKALKELEDRILLLDKLHERFLCINKVKQSKPN
jgi:hypothetical protein